jgi:hypothetical protein
MPSLFRSWILSTLLDTLHPLHSAHLSLSQATFAKVTRAQLEHARCDLDPTNLYFTNLPRDVDEAQVRARVCVCVWVCLLGSRSLCS